MLVHNFVRAFTIMALGASIRPTDYIIQTSSGPVKGHMASGTSHVCEYLGIPYAKPPLGPLRFEAPVEGFDAKINGANFGNACMQPRPQGPAEEAREKLGMLASLAVLSNIGQPGSTSEDCLHLNVWAKHTRSRDRKPVLAWIHGGGFVTGSSAVPAYNGKFFVDENDDIIVVSLNYRLSIFGFSGSPLSPGNVGILDVRMAMEWIHKNIGLFGGDASRIVMAGQSAGGALVDYYAHAYAARPIASGFISQSGVAGEFGSPSWQTAVNRWNETAASLGCTGAPADVRDCMLDLTAQDLVSIVSVADMFDLAGRGIKYNPYLDDGQLLSAGTVAGTPAPGGYMYGNTDNESGFFRVYAYTLPESVWAAVNNGFTCAAAAAAGRGVGLGLAVWRYRYFGNYDNLAITTTPASAAYHTSEVSCSQITLFVPTAKGDPDPDSLMPGSSPQLPMLFDTVPQAQRSPNATGQNATGQNATGRYMRGAWASFVRDSQAGLAVYGWPQYEPQKETLVRIGYNDSEPTNPHLASPAIYDTCA